MNSGLMTFHHNDPENFIDDTEYFLQDHIWLLSIHKVTTIHPTTTQFSTVQLGGG